MPGVTLKLVNTQTAARARRRYRTRPVRTSLLQVPPGAYELTAELQGFAKAAVRVTLQVNTPATLEPDDGARRRGRGGHGRSDESPMINTVDATVGNAFSEVQVRQLPLMTRNVVELLSLQPGVTPTGEVVGARRDQNNITLDGVDVNDNQTAGHREPGAQSASRAASTPAPPRERLQRRAAGAARLGAGVPRHGRRSERQPGTQLGRSGDAGHQERHQPVPRLGVRVQPGHQVRVEQLVQQPRRARQGAAEAQSVRRSRSADRSRASGSSSSATSSGARTTARQISCAACRRRRCAPAPSWRGPTTARPTRSAPDVIKAIDPLGIGASPAMLELFSRCPTATIRRLGRDRGLNFSGFRFNAPLTLDNRAYVGKVDVKLDAKSTHNLSVRTTIADTSEDVALAQYAGPGGGVGPAEQQLRGVARRTRVCCRRTLSTSRTSGSPISG